MLELCLFALLLMSPICWGFYDSMGAKVNFSFGEVKNNCVLQVENGRYTVACLLIFHKNMQYIGKLVLHLFHQLFQEVEKLFHY